MPLFVLLFLIFCTSINAQDSKSIFIRMNQAGFLPDDIKSAVIFSKKPLPENKFFIRDDKGKVVTLGQLRKTKHSYPGFPYCRTADFSDIHKTGKYKLRIKGAKDYNFEINNDIYNKIRDSLLLFFQVQRCGPTDPLLHEECHMSDATRIPGYSDKIYDVTGGWHDAGDYIKFLSTAAYATYMLIFAYDFDPINFGTDNNEDSVPDILEEARVGIDWLLRCRFENDLLITQVQDLRDHEQKWRLPEKDSLRFDRPGFTGIGKNIIGIYTAALAIASRVWSQRFYDYDFAEKCLTAAEEVYSEHESVPDIDIIHSGFYQDYVFVGKLALGAAELYAATKNDDYLEQAKIYADSAGADFWWSWGNINSLAHYRLSKLGEDYSGYILQNLKYFSAKMDSSLFAEGTDYTWGTTNTLLGTALQVILYNNIKSEFKFDSLLTFQRDYVLGRNPWGVSFIYGIGKTYPGNLHSQVGFFNKGYLPGALSAGPAPSELLEKFKIKRTSRKYDLFNSGRAKYYDDFNDFITNEPTITGNATALFVYGFFSHQEYVTD